MQQPNRQRLRIAFYNNLPAGKTGHQDTDTYNTQLQTARLLQSLGHRVEQIDIPMDVESMVQHFLNYYGFFSYMMAHWSRFTLKAKMDRSLLEPFTIGLADRFRANKMQLPGSIRAMRKMAEQAEQLFEKYDVLMTPVLSHKTPKIGYFSPQLSSVEITKRAVDFASYTGLNNVTGSPAISLPLGTDTDGMPIGVHFSAPYGQDKRLIELAYELEAAQPFKMMYDAAAQPAASASNC